MKNETTCPFEGQRDELLISYIYDELEAPDRRDFEAHLPACAACRGELAGLADVRASLAGWASPEPVAGVGGKTPRVPLRLAPAAPAQERWAYAGHRLPAWMQAAAAVLLFSAGLGLANLRVSFTGDGLTIRTGWMQPPAPAQAVSTPAASTSTPGAPVDAPWKADLAALEGALRAELDAQQARAVASVSSDGEALLRRVRTLVAESEQRQQNELALRVAQVAREAQVQRQADLVKIDRSLGLIQSRTGVEAMRTQQQLNSLAQQVSQRP